MKSVSKTLKVDLAQFRELEAFAQFATELDEATKKQLDRGRRAMEIMKQPQYAPISFAGQAVIIFALNAGYIDDVDVEQVQEFEEKLLQYMNTSGKAVLDAIKNTREISEETEKALRKHIEEFKSTFTGSKSEAS